MKTITFKTKNKYHKVFMPDILYLKAEGTYTKIITQTKELSISKPLTFFEKEFSSKGFHRISRSHLINLAQCSEIEIKGRTGQIDIQGEKMNISARRLSKILEEFKKI